MRFLHGEGPVFEALDAAIESVHPDTVIPDNVRRDNGPVIGDEKVSGRIFVFGMGKASYHMALALDRIIGERVEAGLVNSIKEEQVGNISVRKASHPFPDEATLKATEGAVELAKSLKEGDTAVVLISGGGSSMFCMPVPGVSIDDMREISGELMRKGADIWELNTVRRSLSLVKGGGFAHYLRPARVISLIISDVVDNHLPSIASGPTVAVHGEEDMTGEILRRYGLWDSLSTGVKKAISGRKERESADKNLIIADNAMAVRHASAVMTAHGISHQVFHGMKGDVRQVAREISEMRMSAVMGGETTAEVHGSGRGGRNQELVLRALLSGFRGTIAAIGTDGMDGNSPYAGAMGDENTLKKAVEMGIDPNEFLERSDSSSFFEKVGGAIRTGYTGTNVADVVVAIR